MKQDGLVFENRAWEKAEHPRYMSNTLKISEIEERVLKRHIITLKESIT